LLKLESAKPSQQRGGYRRRERRGLRPPERVRGGTTPVGRSSFRTCRRDSILAPCRPPHPAGLRLPRPADASRPVPSTRKTLPGRHRHRAASERRTIPFGHLKCLSAFYFGPRQHPLAHPARPAPKGASLLRSGRPQRHGHPRKSTRALRNAAVALISDYGAGSAGRPTQTTAGDTREQARTARTPRTESKARKTPQPPALACSQSAAAAAAERRLAAADRRFVFPPSIPPNPSETATHLLLFSRPLEGERVGVFRAVEAPLRIRHVPQHVPQHAASHVRVSRVAGHLGGDKALGSRWRQGQGMVRRDRMRWVGHPKAAVYIRSSKEAIAVSPGKPPRMP